MIIDDLRAKILASNPVRPVDCLNLETGEMEPSYVVIVHPAWKDLLRRTAREQYYFDRHIERFNRRQVRLGRPTYPSEMYGEVGYFRGVTVTEEDA